MSKAKSAAHESLMDEEGENQAVRVFLMAYGHGERAIASMRDHMQRCGQPHWPAWTDKPASPQLTKAGAQLWIRYLFGLEPVPHCGDATST